MYTIIYQRYTTQLSLYKHALYPGTRSLSIWLCIYTDTDIDKVDTSSPLESKDFDEIGMYLITSLLFGLIPYVS